jgi:signal recognition particle subunit SRP19
MDEGRILYPCYFDIELTRREGRRAPKKLSIKHPSVQDLVRAAKADDIPARNEAESHPRWWIEGAGRVVVEWEGSKEELIRVIGTNLRKTAGK